jgi:hypothetical protein
MVVRSGAALVRSWLAAAEAWVFTDKRALYGVSLARILSGCAVIGLLVTNFRVRDLVFGHGAEWNEQVREAGSFWQPELVEGLGTTAFLLFYLAVIGLAACWALGWRTRIVGPLMLIGEVAIIESAPSVGDQGDNILRVGVFLLLFMHTNEHWSLDARRRMRADRTAKRTGGVTAIVANLRDGRRVLPLWLTNGVHNVFLAALVFQLIVIYIAAGMYKAQGTYWQHGTALYYPLQLPEFRPFPFLTDLLTHYGVVIAVATYVVLFVQLYFPLLLLNVVTRRIAIGLVIVFHLSIAFLMALPWFSLSMIAFDSVFVSTSTFMVLDAWIRQKVRGPAGALVRIARSRTRRPGDRTAPGRSPEGSELPRRR